MATVVFLRGVNVGGHKKFQPSALVKSLAHLDVVSIGAAGTFVIRQLIAEKALREELRRALPFEAEMMICKGRELLDLIQAEPFGDGKSAEETKRYVSILAKRPAGKTPPLPLRRPDSDVWQVQLFRIIGRFVLSLHRRQGRTLVYPNEVVEKSFQQPATTRNWNTIESVAAILQDSGMRR